MASSVDDGGATRLGKWKKFFWDSLLIILMILAFGIGIGLGLGLRQLDDWSPNAKRNIFFLKFPGDLLMNMLKMLILPLVVSSIVSALASISGKAAGRMGALTIVYYMLTTLIAVIVGIILVLSIQPGYKGVAKDAIARSGTEKRNNPIDSLFDLIRNCFPSNLVEACFQKTQTKVTRYTYEVPYKNISDTTRNFTELEVDDPKIITSSGMNVLGLVVFSVFLGCILSRMNEDGKPLRDFFNCLNVASMKLVTLVIWYAPIGIIFLIAAKLVEMKNPEEMFVQLGYYMLTVLVGLGVHAFIVLPLIFFIGTRKNPYLFMFRMLRALLTAWGTASSSATLPITMECLEYRNKVDLRVAMFMAPIGATINMDGTALYEAVAAIFIAQKNNIDLDAGQVIAVCLTSTAAAIGAAGIPSAGLVTMAIVLTAVGLPLEDVTLIISIDWFLDRFRTAVNVLGDAYGSGLVAHLCRKQLAKMDAEDAENSTHSEEMPEYSFKNDKIRGNINHGLEPSFDEPDKTRM